MAENKFFFKLYGWIPVCIMLLYYSCERIKPNEAETRKIRGNYYILIDHDEYFSHLKYLMKDDGKSIMSIHFQENGEFTIFSNYKTIKSPELSNDIVGINKWECRGDTLVLDRYNKLNLLYIEELNCYSTKDLKLVIKKE